jgi:methyl-accepting chemotaxis protein
MEPLAEGLDAMAAGDLTRRVHADAPEIAQTTRDELGRVSAAVNRIRARILSSVESYNAMSEQLQAMIAEVSGSAGAVSAASRQMSATAEEAGNATGEIARAVGEVAHGAERQVTMLDQARVAAEEAGEVVSASAHSAQETVVVAEQARQAAAAGVAAAVQATEAMGSVRDSSMAVTSAIGELAAKSDQIGAIVQTITAIAEQTNLLALNAAIEAARAGEQGRGFAVVAEEVRKLAEQSQNAAQEIASLIGAIQVETTNTVQVVHDGRLRTEQGAGVVEQTREAFERIGATVAEVTTKIEQIARFAEQIDARRRGRRGGRAVLRVSRAGVGHHAGDFGLHSADRRLGAGSGAHGHEPGRARRPVPSESLRVSAAHQKRHHGDERPRRAREQRQLELARSGEVPLAHAFQVLPRRLDAGEVGMPEKRVARAAIARVRQAQRAPGEGERRRTVPRLGDSGEGLARGTGHV